MQMRSGRELIVSLYMLGGKQPAVCDGRLFFCQSMIVGDGLFS